MPLKSELCALKIGFKPFKGWPGRVTGEVITTEIGQIPMNWCVNIHCRNGHEKNWVLESTEIENEQLWKKVWSHYFSQVINNKFLILEEIRVNLVMFIQQLGCKWQFYRLYWACLFIWRRGILLFAPSCIGTSSASLKWTDVF